MQYITAVIIGIVLVCGTIIILKWLEIKKKEATITGKTPQKKGKSIEDWLDELDTGIQQAEAVYNEQLAICNAQLAKAEITKDQITSIMKPLKERLDFLYTVKKYEPLARMGAGIADRGIKAVNKVLGEI